MSKKIKSDFSYLSLTIVMAGMIGGLVEIGWISLYGFFSTVNTVEVARQIAITVLPFTVNSYYAPLFGIIIHMILSLILAVSFIFIILKPIVHRFGAAGIMLSSLIALGTIWAINFLFILPVVNPAFLLLMPNTVTLISKLLFGLAMGIVLIKSATIRSYY